MQSFPPEITQTLTRTVDELKQTQLNPAVHSPDSYRLAYDDPEFLLRKENRGIRFQLELLKPDVALQELGIKSTVVVYGSARFVDAQTAQERLDAAQKAGDAQAIVQAERAVKNAVYYEKAREFGAIVSKAGADKPIEERFIICTGGGPGIMEAANRGAHEAGALNIGFNITLPHEQSGNAYITPGLSFKFHYFALRKMHFVMRGKALVVFPGGFGTLDELFEVLTLVQTSKARAVPIILFGSAYWKALMNFEVLVETGVIAPEDLTLFSYSDDPAHAWSVIEHFYANQVAQESR